MDIGLGIAQIGHFAGPDQVVAMAVGAEERGYASLWALDRLLAPLVTLATVAASTTTIRQRHRRPPSTHLEPPERSNGRLHVTAPDRPVTASPARLPRKPASSN